METVNVSGRRGENSSQESGLNGLRPTQKPPLSAGPCLVRWELHPREPETDQNSSWREAGEKSADPMSRGSQWVWEAKDNGLHFYKDKCHMVG